MFGQAMPMIGLICHRGCSGSRTRPAMAFDQEQRFPLILAVTVAVTTTSKNPSATRAAWTCSCTSTSGASCSPKMAGEFGCSLGDVLQVDALNLEHGFLNLLLGHGG